MSVLTELCEVFAISHPAEAALAFDSRDDGAATMAL